jgi:hypothetical protein
MKTFIVQYSYPNDSRIAVSEWIEKQTKIIADDMKSACKLFNKKHQRLGTWMILDCWPED